MYNNIKLFSTPLAEGQDPPLITLDPVSIDVTLPQLLELLASPKKCLRLGIDITEERRRYLEVQAWSGYPLLPEIDPNEECEV